MLATADWLADDVYTRADIQRSLGRLLVALRQAAFSPKDIFGIRLALEEALVNAIKHGHRNDTSKRVVVRYQVGDGQFLAEIEDQGNGFDPDALPDPLDPRNLERPGGRGVFLMRQYMTWVQYNEAGNLVTLCKNRSH